MEVPNEHIKPLLFKLACFKWLLSTEVMRLREFISENPDERRLIAERYAESQRNGVEMYQLAYGAIAKLYGDETPLTNEVFEQNFEPTYIEFLQEINSLRKL